MHFYLVFVLLGFCFYPSFSPSHFISLPNLSPPPPPPPGPTAAAAVALTVRAPQAPRRAAPGPTAAAVALWVRAPQTPQRAAPLAPELGSIYIRNGFRIWILATLIFAHIGFVFREKSIL